MTLRVYGDMVTVKDCERVHRAAGTVLVKVLLFLLPFSCRI